MRQRDDAGWLLREAKFRVCVQFIDTNFASVHYTLEEVVNSSTSLPAERIRQISQKSAAPIASGITSIA